MMGHTMENNFNLKATLIKIMNNFQTNIDFNFK